MSREEVAQLIVRGAGVYFLIKGFLSFVTLVGNLFMYAGPLALISQYGSDAGFWSFGTWRFMLDSLLHVAIDAAIGLYLVYRGNLIYRLILKQPRRAKPLSPDPE